MAESNQEPLYFYKVDEGFGEFSNFYRAPILIDGKEWGTTEHYFQAMKFKGTEREEKIRNLARPNDAAFEGREIRDDFPLRKDWEEVKDGYMLEALRAKFTQHDKLRKLLLDTGDCLIIEHTKNDKYWADGGDGSGKNMLGVLLMQVREELRK